MSRGIVVHKVALVDVFSKFVGFIYKFSFHILLHIQSPFGADSLGPLLSVVTNGRSLTSTPWITKKSLDFDFVIHFIDY
jgi:hypothetical protein